MGVNELLCFNEEFGRCSAQSVKNNRLLQLLASCQFCVPINSLIIYQFIAHRHPLQENIPVPLFLSLHYYLVITAKLHIQLM